MSRDFNTQQFLEILTSAQTVVITEKLATRRNYPLGSTMRLMIGDRVLPFVVRGILKNEGPARVLDGNFIMMDIAAAQLAFDRLGRVDRLDVLLPEGADLDRDLDAIAARLPAGVSAQRPSRRGEQVETMLAAFHTNLTALSWIALIVGLFLVYNTVTISVVARRAGDRHAARARAEPQQGAAALPRRGRRAGGRRHRDRPRPGAAARRCGGDDDGVDGEHVVHRRGVGAAGHEPRPSLDRDRDRPAAVAHRRRDSRARGEPRAADRGDARPRHARHAGALQAGRADRRLRVPRRRLRAGATAADRPPPGVRLHVVVRDRDRRRVHGAGDHVRPGAARPADAAAPARRRRPARARQPDVGDSAPVDLGRRAVGEPGDDGRDRGDDRQLPRHGRLLGRPDAARPTSSSAPASGRRSARSRRSRRT